MIELNKRRMALFVIAFMMNGLSSRAWSVNDRGRLQITISNPLSGQTVFGATARVGGTPGWMQALPASQLGPININPSAVGLFTVEFKVTALPTPGTETLSYDVTLPNASSYSCVLTSKDNFQSYRSQCSHTGTQDQFINTLFPDATPPVTSMEVDGYEYFASNGIYISPLTLISLDANDPLVDGESVGSVAFTGLLIDSTISSPTVSQLPIYPNSGINLPSGIHTLTYGSKDDSGNSENPRVAQFFVDGAAPVTSLSVPEGETVDAFGNVLMASGGHVVLTSSDPVVGGVASGVATVLYSLDSAPTTSYTTGLTMPTGFHRLAFASIDNVGNLEALKIVNLFVGVPADTQAPTTVVSSAGVVMLSPTNWQFPIGSTVTLSANDGSGPSVSGVSITYFYLDVLPENCATSTATFFLPSGSPGSCTNPYYTGGFSVAPGTHSLVYFSRDYAGNTEVPHSLSLQVGASQTGGGSTSRGGIGIGVDSFGSLWSIDIDSTNVVIAHNGANSVLIASSVLTNGDGTLPWSVIFGADNSAYAVGSAIGSDGNDLLAIYKASPTGDGIVSSLTFDSGFNSNNFVLSADPRGWTVGAVQLQGSGGQNGGVFAAALWKVNVSQGLVQLTTDYSRSGVDVFTGVTTDANGNVWVAGYSQSPNPRSQRTIDLSVAEYAPDGATLLAGPFLRTGYLTQFDGSQLAQISVSGGSVYVSAARARLDGGTDTGFVVFSTAGAVTAESAWRFSDGTNAYPAAQLSDAQGGRVVVGGNDTGSTQSAIWRYGASGALSSAELALAGGARGAVYQGSNLWIAVDGSSVPFLDTAGETAASGAFVDIEPPRTSLTAGASTFVDGVFYAGQSPSFGFNVVDDKLAVGDSAGVGVAQTIYAVDDASFTVFATTFGLAEGTHTIVYFSIDQEGNAEYFQSSDAAVDLTAPQVSLASSGTSYIIVAQDPVVNGAASGVAAINYLVDTPPNSCHGVQQASTAPAGTCANPNYAGPFSLSVGTHTIYFQAIDNVGNGSNIVNSSNVVVSGGNSGFSSYALNPSTGPIGIPFAVTGPGGFGAYNGGNTRVLFGAVSAPLSVWNDTTIDGSIPNLSTGTYSVSVAIGTNTLGVGSFTVLYPTATSINISSGPIGSPFTIAGAQFGPYGGGLTRVLIGGATAPLSLWNDNAISGSIPALSTGTYAVQLQRATGEGGLMSITPFSVQVIGPSPTGLTPSSGPIGVPFTVTGSGFGPYAGGQTQFLFDGKPAPLSAWNDTTISGSVPNLSSGTHAVWISRQSSDGGLSTSDTAYFTVTVPCISTVAPTSGPIGNGFTLTGRSFGPYAGGYTQALMGGATTSLSVWNDTQIAGTVPGTLNPGTYPLYVERLTSDGGLVASNTVYFTVTAPFGASLSVSSGPIGIPFTITGSGFGAYGGGNTVVQVGGVNAPLSSWSDTSISGSIPNLSTGTYSVVVGRISGSNISSSAVGGFTVLPLSPTGFSPSSGSIGIPFAITGSAFGPYAGGQTRVLFDGMQASLSLWNDANIAGTVPALSTGTHAVWIERASSDGGLESSGTVYFTVTAPNPTGFTPTAGPIGTPFTITGSGFGPYAGGNTRVLIGGVSAPLSLWNDSQISGSIPALSSGTTAVWIERQAGTGVQSSGTTYFNITVPAVASFSPSSAPIGAPFTFLGSSFGSYAGGNTVVLFNGVSAPLSVWNDGQVSGSVPGSLTPGTYGVILQISASGGSVQTSSQAFTVVTPTIQTMDPASGPAGTGVQLTGFGFGPYGGGNTQVLLGTTTVPLSVWNDGRIVWTVPSTIPDGTYPVVVSLTPSGGTVQSASMTFTVGSGGIGGAALALRTVAPLASQPDWHFEGGLLISTVTGGNIQSPSQAAVSVPAGALSTAAVVTMARDHNSYSSARAAALTASSLGAGGEAVSFGPEGTQFAHPVTLVLPYDPALVPDGKLGDLAIHYYDPASKSWTPLVTTADPIRHVVTAQTTHFSLYQPLGHGIGVAAADATFGLKAAYAFPNPVHSGAVTIRIQPGLADTVSVRVYDLSGRKVHDSSNFTQNTVDDGNGLGAQFTYDHTWDINGVGSGVYTFVITAKKAGQSDIHKTGKIGVSK